MVFLKQHDYHSSEPHKFKMRCAERTHALVEVKKLIDVSVICNKINKINLNPRTYKHTHTPPWYRGGVDGPPLGFRHVAIFRKGLPSEESL